MLARTLNHLLLLAFFLDKLPPFLYIRFTPKRVLFTKKETDMKSKNHQFLVTTLISISITFLLPCVIQMARGDDFPKKPIKIMIPFNPGGGVDTTASVTFLFIPHKSLAKSLLALIDLVRTTSSQFLSVYTEYIPCHYRLCSSRRATCFGLRISHLPPLMVYLPCSSCPSLFHLCSNA